MQIDFIRFQQLADPTPLAALQSAWKQSLSAAQDGMWESLTANADQWSIEFGNQLIGYASVDSENRLLQFFVLPEYLSSGVSLLERFLSEQAITQALIGTNNPIGLSLAMHLQKSVEVDTYLFSDWLDEPIEARPGQLCQAKAHELPKMVDFYHHSMDGPQEWLQGYLGDLIAKGEVFYWAQKDEIMGACEVRRSPSDPNIADLGMVISPDHRRKGWGTYLLAQAKECAKQWGRQAICSCEKDNVGSQKAIQNNGFRAIHQMLAMTF